MLTVRECVQDCLRCSRLCHTGTVVQSDVTGVQFSMPNKYSPSSTTQPTLGLRDDQRAIAEAIARSWRRCMVKGVDEQATAEDQVITA